MKNIVIFIIVLMSAFGYVYSEDRDNLSINAAPRGIIPIGAAVEYFNFGYGAALSADFSPSFLPLFLHGSRPDMNMFRS